jgi:hypothetical protein
LFDADHETCAHGYPTAPRLSELRIDDRMKDSGDLSIEIEFCKDFDFGGSFSSS